MNTYKVTFAPQDDIDNIQRTLILAESPEQASNIFADCRVLEVEERHPVELATALEPGPDEAAEIAALLEPETNAELRQGQHMTANLPELEAQHADYMDEKRTQEEARF